MPDNMKLIFIIFNILIFSPDINYSNFWIPIQKIGLSFFLNDKVFDKRSEVPSIEFAELEDPFVRNSHRDRPVALILLA